MQLSAIWRARTLAHYQPIRVTSATNTLRVKELKTEFLKNLDAAASLGKQKDNGREETGE